VTDTLADAPPDAPTQVFLVDPGAALAFNLLDPIVGATDAEGPVTFDSAAAARYGTLSCDGVGSCTYDAPAEGGVFDVVSYTVSDSAGQTASGFVIVDVQGDVLPDLTVELAPGASVQQLGLADLVLNVVHLEGRPAPGVRVLVTLPVGVSRVSEVAPWSCQQTQALVDCAVAGGSSLEAAAPPLVLTVAASASANVGPQLMLASVEVQEDFNVDNNLIEGTLLILAGDVPIDGGPGDAGPGAEDGGSPVVDAGQPPFDAGSMPDDSGVGPDGGPVVADGGPAEDAGAPVVDGGVVMVDSGVMPTDDAGPSIVDGGPMPVDDAGPVVADAGPGVTDGNEDGGAVLDAGPNVEMPGCGCDASRQGAPGAARWPLGVFAAVMLAGMMGPRRRRQRR
jgi:hypothetical protein